MAAAASSETNNGHSAPFNVHSSQPSVTTIDHNHPLFLSTIDDLSTGKVKMISTESHGLYFLMNQRLPGSKEAETSSNFTVKTVSNREDFILWIKD
ncbi:uncharacterized protein LOC107876822 isoform X2 [Capsicum annuum]|uniref:uncharacterized protein LOC107876822 isoform X2 n=1 Tax=Capsicum annuum TaxID=4072 RepID=UPI001FB18A35|nr:uncharacterized protein LOC107876822 isoform X2 [Capsicum annuum]